MQADLGFSDADRAWVVTAYTLAFGGLLLLGGRLGDLLGRKRVFLVGLVGFALASALGGAATGTGMLLGARTLQGVFGALLAPAALSLVATTFTQGKERATAFGVFSPSPWPAARSACSSAEPSPSTSTGAGACTST